MTLKLGNKMPKGYRKFRTQCRFVKEFLCVLFLNFCITSKNMFWSSGVIIKISRPRFYQARGTTHSSRNLTKLLINFSQQFNKLRGNCTFSRGNDTCCSVPFSSSSLSLSSSSFCIIVRVEGAHTHPKATLALFSAPPSLSFSPFFPVRVRHTPT